MESAYCTLANYSWTRGLPYSVVDTPSDTPLEKKDFPFLFRQQTASWLGVALCLLAFPHAGILSCLRKPLKNP